MEEILFNVERFAAYMSSEGKTASGDDKAFLNELMESAKAAFSQQSS
jgi:hypothetical protein